MGQPVAWFDITAKDAGRAHKFYAELFGWNVDANNPMNYGMVDTGSSEGIPGGIGQASDGAQPGVVLYVAVEDAKASLAQVERLGGKTEVAPYEIPGTGVMAVFQDPDGNRVGLWQR
ncbi:VOC family protein [[Actinomadura] parvosata]|uniref:VOC family protein n=1 Tax=[Actinomadura] parvosata TaxID=1955412 RepID=UPI00406D2328